MEPGAAEAWKKKQADPTEPMPPSTHQDARLPHHLSLRGGHRDDSQARDRDAEDEPDDTPEAGAVLGRHEEEAPTESPRYGSTMTVTSTVCSSAESRPVSATTYSPASLK